MAQYLQVQVPDLSPSRGRHHSLPNDTRIKHVITAWKEKNCWEKEVAVSDTDSRLLQELKPTEQKELLCNKCCQRLSSLGLRMEMSQRATGVAWGTIPGYLLAKVTGVIVEPCFPGWELLGSSASASVGPPEGHTSSPGPLVPSPLPTLTPGTASGKSQHRPSVAGFYLWAPQEGPGSWPALAVVLPGEGCWK